MGVWASGGLHAGCLKFGGCVAARGQPWDAAQPLVDDAACGLRPAVCRDVAHAWRLAMLPAAGRGSWVVCGSAEPAYARRFVDTRRRTQLGNGRAWVARVPTLEPGGADGTDCLVWWCGVTAATRPKRLDADCAGTGE